MSRKTYKKLIVTEEVMNNINPKNIKLMQKFLREKSTRSSDLTIKNYESDLNIFFAWVYLYSDNVFFVDMKKMALAEFFSYAVNELKWSSARFSRVRSCISSMANFVERMMDDEYPQFRNLVLRAVENMPKNSAREKTVLTDEQIDELFKKLEEEKEYQIMCWLALGISSGSRFSELLRFTTDIIDEKNTAFDGLFLETTKTIKTKGRTKVGKMLKKYIVKDMFWPHYQKWLEIRNKILVDKNKDHTSIFININGNPANACTVRHWVSKIDKLMEINFYPHAMRHAFTTKLSQLGLPADLIKAIVGWENLEMVTLYDDTDVKDKNWKELGNLKDYLSGKS